MSLQARDPRNLDPSVTRRVSLWIVIVHLTTFCKNIRKKIKFHVDRLCFPLIVVICHCLLDSWNLIELILCFIFTLAQCFDYKNLAAFKSVRKSILETWSLDSEAPFCKSYVSMLLSSVSVLLFYKGHFYWRPVYMLWTCFWMSETRGYRCKFCGNILTDFSVKPTNTVAQQMSMIEIIYFHEFQISILSLDWYWLIHAN